MRFVWQAKKIKTSVSTERRFVPLLNLVMIAYNVIWWFPLVFAFTHTISYEFGFWSFFAITIFRLTANWYRSNILDFEDGRYFPLRTP